MSRLQTAAATHTGYLRTTNQDLALATSYLAAVADGMGGHVGGEVAARMAVEKLLEAYRKDRTTGGLLAAVRDANEVVYHRSRIERNLRGMGTTLTAIAVVGDEPDGQLRLALVNVGDSRGYLLDRPAQRIHKLTEDHSVVEEMVRSGELTPEEAAVHPHRHILTRALGIEPNIEADCWELDLEPGSRLLLCSDGLTNELSEPEIAQVLLETADVEAAANELVRRALQRGGTDNVTVVVVEVLAGEVPGGPDEVVVLPESVGGTPEPAVAGESAAITEAVALTPASAPAPATRAPSAASSPPADQVVVKSGVANRVPKPARVPTVGAGNTVSTDGAPRPVHTRPMVLVPQAKRQKPRGDRIVTIRVALFMLVFVAVLGGAAGFVVWFDKASFFVGLDKGYVAIFQGRPGGLLWFKPSVVERTTLAPGDLLASNVVYLRQGMEESSYQAARNLVHDLSLERTLVTAGAQVTTTTLAPAHTTTTLPPSRTVVRPAVVTSTTGSPAAAPATTIPAPATTTTTPPHPGSTTTTSAPVAPVTNTSLPSATVTTTTTPVTPATTTTTPVIPATTTTTLSPANTRTRAK
jgi:protein phosphatase